ncbi:MAG TPA: DUF4143 domain-containing protein [Chthoniobacterales bacterium]|nr:DUF4143 domain-containing protein [Chthoniobacterales bacterium]
MVNEGGLAKQFIGQALLSSSPFYREPTLYHWQREKVGSSAEVDYVVQHETEIIPIEVKAGKTGSLRSLHALMALRQWSTALRFNGDHPSVTSVNVTTPHGKDHTYQLLSLPLYLVGQWQRLLSELFGQQAE